MKKGFLITILLFLVIIGVYWIKNNKEYDYKIEKVSEYNYFVYKENEKFGVINKNGNVIVNATYENVIIPNFEKPVFICINENKTEVLDDKSNKIFDKYEEIKPIKLKNVANALNYEKSVLIYKKNDLYGLIDFNGKEITKNIYNSIECLGSSEGKFLVSINNKYGVIDLNGKKLVDVKYDYIQSDEYNTKESGYKESGFIVGTKKDDKYQFGYINYKGKKILNEKYSNIERISKEDEKNTYLIVQNDDEKYGFYKNSRKILNLEYEDIVYDENVESLFVKKDKKYGVINLKGKTIVQVNNDEISSRGIYIYAKFQNENKVYDKNGNIININYNKSIYLTESEDYKISTVLNNNIIYYGIIDKNQNQLVEEKYRYIEYLFKNYFIAVNDEGMLGIINSNDKEILEMNYNSIQKIKGKNIIQAGKKGSTKIEFYSQDIKQVLTMEKPQIQTQDEYVIISNGTEKVFLDNNGEIIKDTSNLKNAGFPEKIGEYKKEQITIETVYYTK